MGSNPFAFDLGESEMRNSGVDRRIIKTRNALHSAMIDLLKTTRLEDMTVTMLCNEAKISRSAFYDHYSVPEDCFNEIAMEMNEKIVEQFQADDIKTFEEFIELYFGTVREHQAIFQTLFTMDAQNPALQQSMKFYEDYLHKVVPDYPSYPDIYKRYLLYGFRGVVSEWLNGDCKGDFHEISNLQIRIFNLLRDPSEVR